MLLRIGDTTPPYAQCWLMRSASPSWLVRAGSATITMGSGQATLTFTINGPAGAARLCKVPNMFGLSFTAAKTAIRKANCTLGTVRKVYSNIYYPGVVYSQSPPRGSVLAPRAPVGLTVSLGHRP